jgi:hypothetical protein
MDAAAAEVAFSCGFEVSPTLELELNTCALCEIGDCIHEGESLEIHNEFYGISALIAAETVVKISLGMHGEGRGFLGVVRVWTEAHEASPLAPKGSKLGGYLDYVGSFPDLLDAALRDPQRLPYSISPYKSLSAHPRGSGPANVTLTSVDIRQRSVRAPEAGYADLPPGIGFEPKDEPLRRDINLLGRVLGQVLIEQEGEDLFGTEEEIRLLCKRLRFDYDPVLDEQLKRRIEGMGAREVQRIVRAFSVYFQLVNIAERYHRIRRRRQYESSPANPPQRASLASALSRLKSEGLQAGALQEALDGMNVGLVLTAHPTEALRRSIRHKHVRIGELLEASESATTLTWKERRRLEERLAEEVTILWQTEELRARRPGIAQEIARTLLFFENPLISATIEAYREFED